MAAQILAFPEHGEPAGARMGGRRVYRFPDVARLLGLIHLTPRSIVDTLRDYARQKGMPAPLNPRRHAREILEGAAAIGQRSLWDAAEFDGWRRGDTPPPASAMFVPPAAPALRHTLAGNARMIAGGGR